MSLEILAQGKKVTGNRSRGKNVSEIISTGKISLEILAQEKYLEISVQEKNVSGNSS